jgi:alpha-L-fucosidase
MKPDAKNTNLYLSVFEWPKDGKLVIDNLKNEVESASLLAGGTKLKTKKTANGIVVELPSKAPDAIASVIKLKVKGKVNPVVEKSSDKMKTGELD